jgi:hypothetical protein
MVDRGDHGTSVHAVDITKWTVAADTAIDWVHRRNLSTGTWIVLWLLPGAAMVALLLYRGPKPNSDIVDKVAPVIGIYVVLALIGFVLLMAVGSLVSLKEWIVGPVSLFSLPGAVKRVPDPVPSLDTSAGEISNALERVQDRFDPAGAFRQRKRIEWLLWVVGNLSILSGLVSLVAGMINRNPFVSPPPISGYLVAAAGLLLAGLALRLIPKFRAPPVAAAKRRMSFLSFMMLVALAVAFFFGPIIGLAYLGFDIGSATGVLYYLVGGSVLASCGLAFWLIERSFDMWNSARAYGLPHADALLRSDPRAPVLLLRSFADDGIKVAQRVWDDQIGLEESLQRYLSSFGPVIAIANPRSVPQPGAARVFLPDSAWQARVGEWMAQARIVVVIVGATDAAKWEVSQLVARNCLNKCVFVVPPSDGTPDRFARAIEPFRGTAWEAGMERLSAWGYLRAFYCSPDGGVTVFWSKHRSGIDYVLALAFSLFGLLCRKNA